MRDFHSGCQCVVPHGVAPQVVLTGGPGAGKTAVLELARTLFCSHVEILPESASLLFRGGFPRKDGDITRKAAQRAIFHVQNELEIMTQQLNSSALVLCDRGTLDGLAYWPGTPESYFSEIKTTFEKELSRYHAVIHLRTPPNSQGYNHQNPQRTENAEQALAIDARIFDVWKTHPRRYVIENTGEFIEKAKRALFHIQSFVPACCQPGQAIAQVKVG